MTKQELIELIESLHPEDTKGELTGIFIGRHGEVITTDSIRIDMDGGRVILAQKGSGEAQTNKNNWQKELEFARNRKS
ncbi:MAG: hypothetical protein VW894_02715 [Gammaproteobacteria bacterium]|uniref:Bifunctional protein FolD n=1 Tax=SAR86 cluster bacterium SAR86B TaxID=1123867 RepID=J5KK30_9GAMM|nr:MAG: bifunctional protein FolD [SAR86 cluster bacterium SAR86B]